MAIVKSQIEITAKDSTAVAFASANAGLSGLASSALKVSGALSALGATAVVGSFAAFTKATLDAQDNLSKLSQKTGIAVESLAGLEFAAEQSGVELDKVAKATRSFSLLVAESADASSSAAKKLTQLGLSYKDLKDLSPEKQLLALSDALSKFSKQDQAVALTSVLGNKMADLIPLLSGGSKELGALIEQGKKFNPVTQQSAKQAELFNDQLNVLSKSVSAIGRGLVQEMIPGLSAVADRMAKVTQESGFLKGALAGVKELFIQSFGNPKILGDVGQIRREIFKTQEVIASLSTKKDSVFFDANALQHEKDKLAQLEIDLQKAIVTSRGAVEAQTANTESTKKFAVALDETAPKLGRQVSAQDALQKAQSKSLAVESEYIKLLNIERQARENLLKPYQQEAASAEDRLARMRLEATALDLSQRKQISLEQAIELTTIARLEEKRAITKDVDAVAAIDREIAARKQIISVIKTGEDRTKQLGRVTASTTDEVSQLWMQAGRNIQSALANGIFNFFDDGLKGMVKNVISTVGRIASEFAALKLAQGIGLSSMFGGARTGGGSMAGLFGGIGGTGGGAAGLSAMNISTLGSNGVGLVRSGFGATGLTASAVEAIGAQYGSAYLSAFGAGMNGVGTAGATAGIFSNAGGAGTAYIGGTGTAIGGTGMGTAASMGATFGAGIATAGAAAVGVTLGSLIAGDKQIMGMDGTTVASIGAAGGIAAGGMAAGAGAGATAGAAYAGVGAIVGAIIGGIIAGGFGHAPYKFRQQSLQGEVSPSGIDGDMTNVYRAKGGWFVGNKHKSFDVDIPQKLETLIDKTITGYFKSARKFTENLGFSTDLIDTYTEQIQIKSEKGKQITEEQVKSIFDTLADNVAKRVMPNIEEFTLIGEKASVAFARLNTEFLSLAGAAQNLGSSVADSRSLIGGLGIDKRTDLVEKAGGLGKLSEDTSAFFANFLSDADRLAVRTSQLNERLKELGLAPDLSREQYKALVESPETSDKTRFGLLDKFTQELFLGVRAQENLIKQQRISISLATSAELDKQRQQQKYNSMLALANGTISAIGQGLNKLLNLAGIVKDAQNEVAPQTVEDARASIRGGLNFDRRGNVRGVKGPDYIDQGSIATLASQSTSGFGDRLSFLRSQGKNLEVLQLLSVAVNKSIASERGALQAVASERNRIPIPSFDVGGIVPKTSIAMVHKGERIINPQQNEALVELLQQLITATKSGANYSQSVYNLLKNMTNDGLALNTVAA